MTENTPSNTISTQTPLPSTYLSFASLAAKSNGAPDYRSPSFEKQILENEFLLQTQRNALKTVDTKLNEKYMIEYNVQNENNPYKQQSGSISYEQITPRDIQEDQNSQSISSSAASSSTQQNYVDRVALKMVSKIMFDIKDYVCDFSLNKFFFLA